MIFSLKQNKGKTWGISRFQHRTSDFHVTSTRLLEPLPFRLHLPPPASPVALLRLDRRRPVDEPRPTWRLGGLGGRAVGAFGAVRSGWSRSFWRFFVEFISQAYILSSFFGLRWFQLSSSRSFGMRTWWRETPAVSICSCSFFSESIYTRSKAQEEVPWGSTRSIYELRLSSLPNNIPTSVFFRFFRRMTQGLRRLMNY